MFKTLGLVFALSIGLTTDAFACLGETVLFEDTFKEKDGSWFISNEDASANYVSIDNGRLKLRPPPEKGRAAMVAAVLHPADVDICTKVIITAGGPTDMNFGIDFWASGGTDSYSYFVNGAGSFGLSRWNGKSWIGVLPVASTTALRAGIGEENTLRILAKDGMITMFINDIQVGKVRGQKPTVQTQAGVRVFRRTGAPVSVEYTRFKVTNTP